MVIPMVTYVVVICVLVGVADFNDMSILPADWKRICTARFDSNILARYVENVQGNDHVIHVQCHVDGHKGDSLHIRTLRDHLRPMMDISIFLQIRCSNRGQISLPWPMKARGLIGVVVSNCILSDKYADFGNADLSNIPDVLRVMEIRNSAWLSDETTLDKMTSPDALANLTSDYDCGQDSTIEYLVNSNVSYLTNAAPDGGTLAVDPVSDTSKSQANTQDLDQTLVISNPTLSTPSENKSLDEEFVNLLHNLQSLNLQCNYQKLKLLDESIPHVLPVQHFALMVQGAKYPDLRSMNYSFAGIRDLPEELRDFRTYFPRLENLDLSWNYLTEVELASRSRGVDGRYLILDVRHNLISNISVDYINSWAMVEGVTVDIRDNPIYCGCGIQHLLQKIQSETFFVGQLEKYSYIQEMRCADPLDVRGQKLSDVTLRCVGDNRVLDSPTSQTSGIDQTVDIIVGCTIAAIVVIIGALLAVVVVNLRLGSQPFKRCHTDFKPAPEAATEVGKVNLKTKDVP